MARVTVEDCLEQVPNRFALVHLAARRAKQILKGADTLVDSDNKEIVTALREIAASKVRFSENENVSKEAEKELCTTVNLSDLQIKTTNADIYTVDVSYEDVE